MTETGSNNGMNGMVKLEDAALDKSRALFLKFMGKRIGDNETAAAVDGDRVIKADTFDCVIRFRDGFIHGGKDPDGNPQPAIECVNAHTEWWEDGWLHRDGGPAVIHDFGDWEEYWDHGNLVAIYYSPPDKIGGEN
jgi:hypothetical protein